MSWRDSKDWWKAPVLQGPENDYGEYDYLAEELPKDGSWWEFSRAKWKCDCCKKYHHFNLYSKSYFYCYDGWDSMDYMECWVCIFISYVRRLINNAKAKINARQKRSN